MTQSKDQSIDIFLAEDNEGDIYLIREALNEQQLRAQLYIAKNGEEALRYIEQTDSTESAECPRLFMLDLNLPRVNGSELLQRIKESRKCSKVPILVFSSSDSPNDKINVETLGAHFMSKPSNLVEFMKVGEIVKNLCMEKHPCT